MSNTEKAGKTHTQCIHKYMLFNLKYGNLSNSKQSERLNIHSSGLLAISSIMTGSSDETGNETKQLTSVSCSAVHSTFADSPIIRSPNSSLARTDTTSVFCPFCNRTRSHFPFMLQNKTWNTSNSPLRYLHHNL